MAVTMDSATFMWKNFQNNQNSIVNIADLTLKQMFGISAKLVGEQDEISGVETIRWEKHSWNFLSLIGDERVINPKARKSTSFRILCCVLGRSVRILNLTNLGRTGKNGSQLLKGTETLMESVESRLNSSGTSSQDSIRCSSMVSHTSTEQIWRNTRKFHKKNHIYVDVQRHFLWNERQ